MDSSKIVGVFFYQRDARSQELIKTAQMMVPDVHARIVWTDVSGRSAQDMPAIVKKVGQLPIFVCKGQNTPLVGIEPVQRWLAAQAQLINSARSSSAESSSEKDGADTSDANSLLIFRNDGGIGAFMPSEMGAHGGSSYAYIGDKEQPHYNFERLDVPSASSAAGATAPRNAVPPTPAGNFESKSSKSDQFTQSYERMMSERKKLFDMQTGSGAQPLYTK